MTTFPLAGLLRVRGAQERVAAEQLARATADVAQAQSGAQNAAASLAGISSDIGDGPALLAMAAARAAGRSALSDLQTLTELRRSEADAAKASHVEARRELRGLERLESAHIAVTTKAELDAEQSALDEVAVVRALQTGSAA
ncbi:hypothetical protein [Microbacterium candidum]|uniref:Flagellar FliJ protein n=1 Tax=Microbacterium candidum TaxID=3041922 RepID=A0ABT7MTV2_9MICO|nr:hypothetical protein [Microbacterium sp. ASV49]MDL9977873.1 hypothetical protein [Microbacterium sp. ASV49]